jgi:CheY-like chemotaxis protein
MAAAHGGGRLSLTTTHDGTWIYIRITDTGPGIAPENLCRVFDPFYTTKEKGTGLGLGLSYGLIKEHGGEILVTSTPGEGATFTITLPVLEEPFDEPETCPTLQGMPLPAMQALVVDDEKSIAQMLVTTLQTLGHQAEAVFSGQEAMQKIDQGAYDLIICDMKMPVVDGRQVYRFTQSHYPALLSRFVFSSGDSVSEENRTFLEETGCLFLPKPFLMEELRRLLEQVASLNGMAAPVAV